MKKEPIFPVGGKRYFHQNHYKCVDSEGWQWEQETYSGEWRRLRRATQDDMRNLDGAGPE